MARDTHQPTKNPAAVLDIEVEKESGSGSYFHVYARTRVVSDGSWSSRPAGTLAWPMHGHPYPIPYLPGLIVSCQGNNRADQQHGMESVYAWAAAYENTGSVDLGTAEAMFLTLKRIDAGLAKMAAVEGRPHTFGTYVARIARALGITTLTCPSEFAPNGYRRMSPVDGGEHIDYQIANWQHAKRKRFGTAAADAA